VKREKEGGLPVGLGLVQAGGQFRGLAGRAVGNLGPVRVRHSLCFIIYLIYMGKLQIHMKTK
jgi:hypothetical protein